MKLSEDTNYEES